MLSIGEVQESIFALSEDIDAPKQLLTVHSQPVGDGSYHLEIRDNGYNFVSSEKGVELDRKVTTDVSELYYWILDDVTLNMAISFEKANRIPAQDHRRVIFKRKIFLLKKLNQDWAIKAEFAMLEILKKSPFDDQIDKRLMLCKELTGKGFEESEAYTMACDKYPLPDE